MINKEDWKIVNKVQKAVLDWGQHKEINDAISFFQKRNKEAYKILVEMANIEARKGEETIENLRPLLFKLKEVLSNK